MQNNKSLPWLVGGTKFVDDDFDHAKWQVSRTVIAEIRSPKGRCLIFDSPLSVRDGYTRAGEAVRSFMEFSNG